MNTSRNGRRPIRERYQTEGTREGPPVLYHPHFEQDFHGLVTHYERDEDISPKETPDPGGSTAEG